MAKALDDNELVFQLQLEENKKVSNQTRKAGVPSDLFQVCLPTGKSSHVPRFCDTKRNGGGRNNFYTRLNSNDYSKPSLDRLIAEQVQLETDKDIAKELDKDINNLEEQDRILAERMQLESDLESAKELDKHNSRQNGLFNLGNIENIRHDLPQGWSNSPPFGMQREAERPNSHQIQHTPYQVQSEQFHRNFIGLLNGTSYRGRPTSVQISNTLVATELLELGEVKIRGLQQSEIETLPKETIKDLKQIEETQCVICFENFQLEDGFRKLSCSHVYHVNCIDKWLKVKAECPVCKKNVKGDTIKNN